VFADFLPADLYCYKFLFIFIFIWGGGGGLRRW
jgi:hypothetical protein